MSGNPKPTRKSPACNCDTGALGTFNCNAIVQHIVLIPVLILTIWWNAWSGPTWQAMSALWLLCAIASISWSYAYCVTYCCCAEGCNDPDRWFKGGAVFHLVYSVIVILAIIVMGATIQEATEAQCDHRKYSCPGPGGGPGGFHCSREICGVETTGIGCAWPEESSNGDGYYAWTVGNRHRNDWFNDCGHETELASGPRDYTGGGEDNGCWVFNTKEECATQKIILGDHQGWRCGECATFTHKEINTYCYLVQMAIMLVTLSGTLAFGSCATCCNRSGNDNDGIPSGQVHPAPTAAVTFPVAAAAAAPVPATAVAAVAVPAQGTALD